MTRRRFLPRVGTIPLVETVSTEETVGVVTFLTGSGPSPVHPPWIVGAEVPGHSVIPDPTLGLRVVLSSRPPPPHRDSRRLLRSSRDPSGPFLHDQRVVLLGLSRDHCLVEPTSRTTGFSTEESRTGKSRKSVGWTLPRRRRGRYRGRTASTGLAAGGSATTDGGSRSGPRPTLEVERRTRKEVQTTGRL